MDSHEYPPAAIVLAVRDAGTPDPPPFPPAWAYDQLSLSTDGFKAVSQDMATTLKAHGHRLLFVRWLLARSGGHLLSKRVCRIGWDADE